jgi:Caspase domain
MAGRYRALLIGNSTYPADEHNLQALKGPVKDIAAVNRALADSATGLFADADVTLLPEVTSARAIRAMGRFFGAAARDDVLLLYFSGHGKLDQAGRLHLCMQDTETTDLLATAVSSARINEFADASHASNIVIVLDCCFSGAFRGADLGDAVAGPGRYVLTSCRGTQLANDATVENSTSHFTQHLVEGLLGAAADHDGDGYVSFSELYAYVDRRLRETGKQIPQRRVTGDGDLRLARRRPQVPAQPRPLGLPPEARAGAGAEPGAGAGADAGGGGAAAGPGGRRRWTGWSRRTLLLTSAATVAAAGGAVGAVLAAHGGEADGRYTSPKAFTATSPWQLKVDASAASGCSVWLIDARSGALVSQIADSVSAQAIFQISGTGTFKWQANDARCQVIPQFGVKPVALPLAVDTGDPSDTDVFVTPAKVSVQITDYHGDGACDLRLYDAVSGTELDSAKLNDPQRTPVVLDSGGRKTAYLWDDGCAVRVTAAA